MAVISTYIYNTGSVFENQYCRIEQVEVKKDKMKYEVGIYLGDYATDNPPHAIESFESSFDLYSDKNVWQQAYEDLKTHWTDTVDA